MTHGTQDWGLVGPKATTYGLDDLGEHAVRVGSPVTFDRRGDVIWWTDFRYGMGDVVPFGTVGRQTILITGEPTRQGPYSLDLYLPLLVDGHSAIRKYLPYPVASRMGIEATFQVDSYHDYWCLDIYVRKGATEMQSRLRYNLAGDVLEVMIGLNTYQEVATGMNPALLMLPLVTAKMVVDVDAEEYVRAIFNDTEYPLAGVGCYTRPLFSARYCDCRILAYNTDDDEMHGYVDSIIVTQNEPT